MMTTTEKGSTQGGGLGGVVKLVVQTFLEQDHYRTLHRALSEQWSDTHSLSAAVRLMEAHGVKVTPEEEQELAQLPEENMIDALVERMPQQSREQFEHFFLQLSFIASTTARLRTALEVGQPEVIEEALDSAETVGVLPYFMKMVVAQAGQEVKSCESAHETWIEESDAKLAPLLQNQASSMVTKKGLSQAKSDLATFRTEAKDKSQVVLLRLAEGNDKFLLGSVFLVWSLHVAKVKKEQEIRLDYQDQIAAANKELFAYREKQLATVKSVLIRSSKEAENALVLNAVAALKQEAANMMQREAKAQLFKQLEDQSKAFIKRTRQNALKVLSRMNDSNEQGQLALAFESWKEYLAVTRKDQSMNESSRGAKNELDEFRKRRKQLVRSVVAKMMRATDQGAVASSFKGWCDVVREEKAAARAEADRATKASQLFDFASKNKKSARSATERTALLQIETLLITCFVSWKREWRIEDCRRFGRERNEKRTQDLLQVKGLFSKFATELDSSLKDGTPRPEAALEN